MLDNAVAAVPLTEGFIVGSDLNCHIGAEIRDFEKVMEVFSFGDRNR